jgi:hypothetical protein
LRRRRSWTSGPARAPAFVQGHTFAQFIALMHERGFELRDILSAPRSRMSGEVIYIDGFFAPTRPIE